MSAHNASAAGGAILTAIFAFKSKFPSSLFSYHPTLMGAAWLGLAPLAIKHLRASKKCANAQEKESHVIIHRNYSGLSFAAALAGAYAIFRNKEVMAAAKNQVAKHLVSPHGKLGALSTLFVVLTGIISLYRSAIASKKKGLDYLWRDKIHRLCGMLAYCTAGLSILVVVNAPWGKFNLGPNGQKAVSAAIITCQALVIAPWVGLAQ